MTDKNASIIGIGTDVTQIPRIEKLYEKFGDKFLYKNYHEVEIQEFHQLDTKKKHSFLAKRFAGKEAVSKAFGIGIGALLSFKDIAIVNDEVGAPIVKIFNKSVDEFTKYNIYISLSDDYPVAIAFAVVAR